MREIQVVYVLKYVYRKYSLAVYENTDWSYIRIIYANTHHPYALYVLYGTQYIRSTLNFETLILKVA